MKYAIQDEYWWFDTRDYIDHKDTGWVYSIIMPKFKDRKKNPSVSHTQKLSEAKLYDTSEEATAVAKIISTPKCPAEVILINDKRLFEAKLKGT
jgi:hypothetical protein